MFDMNVQLKIDAQVIGRICVMVDTVTADVREIVATGQYPVVTLLRAYDLLEVLQEAESALKVQYLELQDKGQNIESEDSNMVQDSIDKQQNALSGYKEEYERSGERLMQVLEREVIARKAEAYLQPWKRKFDKADSEYKKAVELWEAAKVAHKAQEEGGFMERWRTLRAVRKLAGFRLERRRTGNFVARTLELMQQAMLRAREAELIMYDHNVGYKCNPDVYLRIYEIASKMQNMNNL